MSSLFTIFLVLHIVCGAVGLITGTINLIRRKGDQKHRLIGKVFSSAMLVTGFSAFVLAILHPNYFLFMVGVFTIYLCSTGHRYLYLKRLGIDQRAKVLDWVITIGMSIAGILFLVLGIKLLIQSKTFGIVFIVFGGLGLLFVIRDIKNYTGKELRKTYWLTAHLQRMTGAYIASLTAFLVVNAKYSPIELPLFLFWLLPTLILTPLIIRWSGKYEGK